MADKHKQEIPSTGVNNGKQTSGLFVHLFVVLLQGSHVLPGLAELSLLHALPNIPVCMKVMFCLMQDSTWMSK